MKLIKSDFDVPYFEQIARAAKVREMLDEFVASGEKCMQIKLELEDHLAPIDLQKCICNVLDEARRNDDDAYAGVYAVYLSKHDSVHLCRNPNL